MSTVTVGKHGRNAGWWRVRDAIKAGLAFSNYPGSFRGGPVRLEGDYPVSTIGQLPRAYWTRLKGASYVVWSYETPIAWRVGGTWITPDVHYSPTTSQHQGQTNTAICAIETDLT